MFKILHSLCVMMSFSCFLVSTLIASDDDLSMRPASIEKSLTKNSPLSNATSSTATTETAIFEKVEEQEKRVQSLEFAISRKNIDDEKIYFMKIDLERKRLNLIDLYALQLKKVDEASKRYSIAQSIKDLSLRIIQRQHDLKNIATLRCKLLDLKFLAYDFTEIYFYVDVLDLYNK